MASTLAYWALERERTLLSYRSVVVVLCCFTFKKRERKEHGMELTVTHMVRKLPSSSPSDALFGSCPSRAALSPSAVAVGAAPSLGGGAVRPVDADAVRMDRGMPSRSSLLSLQAGLNRPLFASSPSYERDQATDTPAEQGTGHSVLVVEDDPDIAMGLHDLLEFEGFHVDCAPTCRHAFSSIEQHGYDAVLLDLGLPDGDGLSVLETLQVSHPALPVIILTASNRDLGSVRAFARLTKPWERKELCRLLRQATGQTPSSIKV